MKNILKKAEKIKDCAKSALKYKVLLNKKGE